MTDTEKLGIALTALRAIARERGVDEPDDWDVAENRAQAFGLGGAAAEYRLAGVAEIALRKITQEIR